MLIPTSSESMGKNITADFCSRSSQPHGSVAIIYPVEGKKPQAFEYTPPANIPYSKARRR